MNILLIYALLVLILIGVSTIVVLNFTRYRYTGDLTGVFILAFIAAFIGTFFLTLAFINPAALTL